MPIREEVFGIVVDHQQELVRANVEVMSYRLCHSVGGWPFQEAVGRCESV
jgi:hypothetical protein